MTKEKIDKLGLIKLKLLCFKGHHFKGTLDLF